MTRRLYFYILYLLIVSTLSCSIDNSPELDEPNSLEFSDYFNDVINQAQIALDTVANAHIKSTLSDGDTVEFIIRSGQIDSALTVFYPSGRIKMTSHFDNGPFSLGAHSINYDDEIELIFSTDEDTLVGNWPRIRTYYFTDHNSELIYMREYDSLSNPVRTIGSTISMLKLTSLEYLPNDTIPLQVYLVPEPYWARYYDLRREVALKIIKDDLVIDSFSTPINEDYNCAFVFKTFEQAGKYRLRAISKYSDIFWTFEGDSIGSVMLDSSEVEIEIIQRVEI